MARAIFMGTPQFAVPTLRGLTEHHTVVAVITQPDRPAGRGRRLAPAPVKEFAQAHGLPLLQPPRVRDPAVVAELAALNAEVTVVAAFGQILPQEILDVPAHGSLNVHASLLPRWRGAAPIPAAILAGDAQTGVTIMLMDAGLDTGPILVQRACPVGPEDTTGTLTARLAQMGADLLLAVLPGWLHGEIVPQRQDPAGVTLSPRIDKKAGHIDWGRSADEIDRQVRAYQPWPGAYTAWQGRQLKILRATPLDKKAEATPGTVVALPEGPAVVTGQGVLLLREVQVEGKRPTQAETFVRGARGFIGEILT
jgi:methionyl-tRNA formyltransferase